MKRKDFVSKIENASFEAKIHCYVTAKEIYGYVVLFAHNSYIRIPLRRVIDIVYDEYFIHIRCTKNDCVRIYGDFMVIEL